MHPVLAWLALASLQLPPKAVAPLSAEQEAALEKDLATAVAAFAGVESHARAADAEIFLKAVRYALDYDEWYDKKPEDGVRKAAALIAEAGKRIEALKENRTPWLDGPGLKVLGYYSKIDGSPQPYGLEVPEGLKKPPPLWIWLHGRGETQTDLHFVYGRLNAKKPGQFSPAAALVVHPFGRYCNGWKSAGESDVFECRDDVAARFRTDPDRVVLAGFSMGGAGAWHIGAHFADQWAAVHAGAGFVDVKRFQKLTPEQMPPPVVQTLWSVYDVPCYARNFMNVPLINYSGEKDRQRDAAEFMTEVFAPHGITRPHVIGAGMEHQYNPEGIKEVQAWLEKAVEKGRDRNPRKVSLQTRTMEYSRMHWVQLSSMEKQWEDTRIDAELGDDGVVRVKTVNVDALSLPGKAFEIDGQKLTDGFYLVKSPEGRWRSGHDKEEPTLRKKPGQSGPIEESLKRPFLVVLPEGDSASPQVTEWVKAESARFLRRWRSLMRGDARVKKAADVTPADMERYTLVLWGDAKSNSLIARILPVPSFRKLPLEWTAQTLNFGGQSYDASTHVLVMLRPNPLDPRGTVILNSGLTFREAHDRSNALQNPQLPDWAVIDVTTPPDNDKPGRIAASDFFEEDWTLRP